MQKPFISVVIPCYNVEAYLPKCIKSLQGQSFSSFEAIFVDDGSTDQTQNTIRALIQDDARFKIISQSNQGAATARNTGLDKASGACIYFMDADDLLDCDCFQELVNLYHPSMDVVYGKNAKVKGQIKESAQVLEQGNPEETILTNEPLLQLALEQKLLPVVWNKLYNRKFILENQLRFRDGLYHEDELWFFEVMLTAKKIIFSSKTTYFYNIGNENSLTKTYDLSNLKAFLFIIEEIYNKYYTSEKDNNKKKVIVTYILHLQIDAVSVFFRYLKKNKVAFKSEGVALLQDHLNKIKIDDYKRLSWDRNPQLDIFVEFAAKNPETAFKLMRNRNKRNILKFFENLYLRWTA